MNIGLRPAIGSAAERTQRPSRLPRLIVLSWLTSFSFLPFLPISNYTMNIDPWSLETNAQFFIENDADVKLIMLQLGVPDLFAKAVQGEKPSHIFAAFDNHPTHWLLISLYSGIPDYSPNHTVHKLIRKASPNGLLFIASPKTTTNKEHFLKQLSELREGETLPPLSQLPDR